MMNQLKYLIISDYWMINDVNGSNLSILLILFGEKNWREFWKSPHRFILPFEVGLFQQGYPMGPYNAGPNLTPAPLTPALINCAEYKKVFISAFNGNIRQKIS